MADNIVDQAARIIAPDWYGDPLIETATGKMSPSYAAMRNYKQAEARHLAWQVLKLAEIGNPALAKVLADIEKEDWESLGVPVLSHAELFAIVDGKHRAEASRG